MNGLFAWGKKEKSESWFRIPFKISDENLPYAGLLLELGTIT
jgi:hypothetical protein